MSKLVRCYSELIKIPSFEDRVKYLQLHDGCGEEHDIYRKFRQAFYHSDEWRSFRNYIVARDFGCDLAHRDREIRGSKIIIHHINVLSTRDIDLGSPLLFDPENVVTTTLLTHNIIHYGNRQVELEYSVERRPNDTCPWKAIGGV